MTPLDVRPPDLEMRIRIAAEHGKTRLRFTLNSPNGSVALAHREIEGPLLQRSPEDYQGFLLAKIERLAERLDVDRSLLLEAEARGKLESLGRDLWRELFPAELQAVYRSHIRPKVRSWVIVSDEPWIPWELVKPYDDGAPGEPLDDDFLCLRFELTRWLAGVKPFASTFTFRRLAVAQSAPELPHASQERRIFKNLQKGFPGLDVEVPPLDSASDFLDFLGSVATELVHLVGHGTPLTASPDEAGLPFPDRSVLRPPDLDGSLATLLGKRRPMVFLNACWAGKEGWSLTRLGGWAARWIGVCGCGAFVAPLWPVRDRTALAFAWSFYEALAQGATFGRAVLEARRKAHAEHPGDPSALAYTAYGHPNAEVLFQERQPDEGAREGAATPSVPAPRWKPRYVRPRRLKALSSVCGLALVLSLSSGPVADRLYPVEECPKRLLLPKRKPSHELVATCSSAPGLRLDLTGGTAVVRSAVKSALCRSAASLAGSKVAGWTLAVALDPSEVVTLGEGELAQKSCQLSAQATAIRSGTQVDLGAVRGRNAQFNRSIACEEAAAALAGTVASRWKAALSKKGEA